jgi:hypothetical protein
MKRYFVERDGDVWKGSIREGANQTAIGRGFSSREQAMEAVRAEAGENRAIMIVEPRPPRGRKAAANA